jgi:hypothetical protein
MCGVEVVELWDRGLLCYMWGNVGRILKTMIAMWYLGSVCGIAKTVITVSCEGEFCWNCENGVCCVMCGGAMVELWRRWLLCDVWVKVGGILKTVCGVWYVGRFGGIVKTGFAVWCVVSVVEIKKALCAMWYKGGVGGIVRTVISFNVLGWYGGIVKTVIVCDVCVRVGWIVKTLIVVWCVGRIGGIVKTVIAVWFVERYGEILKTVFAVWCLV